MLDLSNPELNLPIEKIKKQVFIVHDPLEACDQAHSIVVCTEWDEFKVCLMTTISSYFRIYTYFSFQTYDYQQIYDKMLKPASIFDGRLVLDHEKLQQIGFEVEAIGKCFK